MYPAETGCTPHVCEANHKRTHRARQHASGVMRTSTSAAPAPAKDVFSDAFKTIPGKQVVVALEHVACQLQRAQSTLSPACFLATVRNKSKVCRVEGGQPTCWILHVPLCSMFSGLAQKSGCKQFETQLTMMIDQ
jgi:hypothetical protein